MKVICKKCSASYDIENQRIPVEGMTMKCPKCLGSFQVQRPDQGGASAPKSAGADTKYFIRRHTGSVFGPFAQSAILTMATDGKLDGSEDLSPDKVDWKQIAAHAAFATVFGEGAQSASKPEPESDLPAPTANQPPKMGAPKPAPIPDIPQSPSDLPTPAAAQPTRLGMPNIKAPSAPEVSDLPAPKAAAAAPKARPAPSRPAIAPPPPEMPDLPAPKAAASGPTGRPAPSKPAITPPAPGVSDLPAPKAAGSKPKLRPAPSGPIIAPPPPEMPDLPTPLVTGGTSSAPELPAPRARGAAAPPVAPSRAPEMPDLPAPKKAGAAPGGLAGLPDLPAPKGASAPPSLVGANAGVVPEMPDLPTPKGVPGIAASQQPNLPTPKGAHAPGGEPVQPDLPTPKGAHAPGGEPVQPDLPTPRGAADPGEVSLQPDLPTPTGDSFGVDQDMGYGEVDLPVPAEEGEAGIDAGAPLDLSELDLVAPKVEAADDVPDLSELDLVAPKEAGPEAVAPIDEDSLGDVADLLEPESAAGAARAKRAAAKSGPRAAAPMGDRLLGLPKSLAIGIVVGVVLIGAGAAAYVFIPRGKKDSSKGKSTVANTNNNAVVVPRAAGRTRVAHAPAMDLDTHKGYLAADKTYRKQLKKTGDGASLKAARAKARLCDAYRYGVKGKRLAMANKLLAAADANDVERRKAKALWYLLRKKLPKARKQLKKARAKAKKDPEVYLFLGWVELAAGRMDRAEKAFRRAVKYRGESAAALFGLARSLATHRDPAKVAEGRTLLAKVVKLSPRHVQARVALLMGGPAKASVAGIKVLTELSDTLGDTAAPLEQASLALGLGLVNRRAGKLDRALTHLAKASKLAPQEAQILRSEGEALLEAGDGERAAERLAAALKLAPHSDRLLEALVRAHIARDQPMSAKDAILAFGEQQPTNKKGTVKPRKKKAGNKKVRKKRRRRSKRAKSRGDDDAKPMKLPGAPGPRTPYLSLARGRTAMAFGKIAEAKNLYLESTADAPRFTPGHVAYLELMLQGKRLEGMRSVFDLIKRKYRDALPAALRDMEGRLLLARSKPVKAENAFRAALETEPHNNRILIHLALCLWQNRNQPEEAYLLLQKIYKRAKSLTRVVSLLADYHWKSGDKNRAFGRFKAALKINQSLTLRRRYAELLLRAPNPVRLARAEKLLGPILKANAMDHGATALFALVELGKNQPKEAMVRIKRALKGSPKKQAYLVIRARIAEASGHPKEALTIYENLLEKQPNQPQIALLRARLLCRNRITKRCLKAAKAVLKRWGVAEGHLLMGLAQLQQRKSGKAMRSFKKAIAKNKDYAEAHFLLGRTQFHDAVFRKALTSLIRCLELADETARWWPDVHYFLGMSSFKVNNKRMAGKHLKKYLSTQGNPDNVETSEQKRSAKSTLKKL